MTYDMYHVPYERHDMRMTIGYLILTRITLTMTTGVNGYDYDNNYML